MMGLDCSATGTGGYYLVSVVSLEVDECQRSLKFMLLFPYTIRSGFFLIVRGFNSKY